MKHLLGYVSDVESRLGIRAGFFNELIKEDDWGFVVKLHAFIDAALTDAICSTIGHLELQEVVGRLDVANRQYGKLAFAKALGILDKPRRRFISELCTLRNVLAHNVRLADFSFAEHMKSMTEKRRLEFCVALSLDEVFDEDYSDDEIRLISLVNEVPKFGIGCTSSILISDMYMCSMQGELDSAYKKVGEKLVAQSMEAMRDVELEVLKQ